MTNESLFFERKKIRSAEPGDLFRHKTTGELKYITCYWDGVCGGHIMTHRFTLFNPDGTQYINDMGNGVNIASGIDFDENLEKVEQPFKIVEVEIDRPHRDTAKLIIFE